MTMGNKKSTPEVPSITHEQMVNIVNASNTQSKEHSAKSAASLELIAYSILAIVIAAALFGMYRLITKYERMKNQARIDRAISINNVHQV